MSGLSLLYIFLYLLLLVATWVVLNWVTHVFRHDGPLAMLKMGSVYSFIGAMIAALFALFAAPPASFSQNLYLAGVLAAGVMIVGTLSSLALIGAYRVKVLNKIRLAREAKIELFKIFDQLDKHQIGAITRSSIIGKLVNTPSRSPLHPVLQNVLDNFDRIASRPKWRGPRIELPSGPFLVLTRADLEAFPKRVARRYSNW